MLLVGTETQIYLVDLPFVKDFDYLIIAINLGLFVVPCIIGSKGRYWVAGVSFKHNSFFEFKLALFSLFLCTIEHLCENAADAPYVSSLIIICVADYNLWRSIPS